MRAMRLGAVLSVVLLGGILSAAGAGVKVAVVHAGRLIKEYHKTELADTHMEEQMADFSAERDKLLSEHRRIRKDYETVLAEAKSKVLSEETRAKKEEDAEEKLMQVMEYETKVREMAVSRKKQIEEEGRRIHRRLVEEIRDAVATYAKTNGYTLVLDASGLLTSGFESVLYSDPQMDITEAMLGILNPPGVGGEKVEPRGTAEESPGP